MNVCRYCIIPCTNTPPGEEPGRKQLQHLSVPTTAAALRPRGRKIRRVLLLHDRRAASYLGQKQYRRRDANGSDVSLRKGQMHCPLVSGKVISSTEEVTLKKKLHLRQVLLWGKFSRQGLNSACEACPGGGIEPG